MALADKAFKSTWIDKPEDLYIDRIPSHLQSIKLDWKSSMLEVPLFRRAVWKGGSVHISPYKSVQYTTIHHQNLRLGKSAGFSEPLGLYNYRRGAGEAIDRKNPLIILSGQLLNTHFLVSIKFSRNLC